MWLILGVVIIVSAIVSVIMTVFIYRGIQAAEEQRRIDMQLRIQSFSKKEEEGE